MIKQVQQRGFVPHLRLFPVSILLLTLLPGLTLAQDLVGVPVSSDGTVASLPASTSFLATEADANPREANAYAVEGPGAFFGSAEVTEGDLLAEGVGLVGAGGEVDPELVDYLNSLPALGADPQPEVIIGDDTRVRINPPYYPSRAVVLITFDQGRCSGALIGPDTVATAGHCVHSGGAGGSWRTNVRVYPAFDQSSAPYGYCTGQLWSNSAWTSGAWVNYDYGAIKLNCSVGNTVGWFGFRTGAGWNTPSIITGYPGDKPLQMWQSSDKIRGVWAYRLFYANDTVGGMSGSPVWEDWYTRGQSVGPRINAIHAYGGGYNSGTRMIKDVFDFYVYVKNL